ncbi:MAG: glycosyltransferase [Planctomycetes bacterium]|nr:glycosyltransferase [Planctomycetota bacterium]
MRTDVLALPVHYGRTKFTTRRSPACRARPVLLQGYSHLQYVVMDGGNTDGSVDVIRRYERHLHFWQSGPDNGQSAAINAGLARCTGETPTTQTIRFRHRQTRQIPETPWPTISTVREVIAGG